MSPAILVLIMLVIVVGFILWNKVPLNFTMFVVPIFFSILTGYNLIETSTFIINQINLVMSQTGYMLLFGLIYFTMLTETGMFDTIVNAVMKKVGDRLNVVGIMVLTTVL